MADKNIVFYRSLYGEDYIIKSIASIYEYANKIHIFWTDKPWGSSNSVMYFGHKVYFPAVFDSFVEKVRSINDPENKIVLEYYHQESPLGMFTPLLSKLKTKYPECENFLLMEPDHILLDPEEFLAYHMNTKSKCSTTTQVEFWKTDDYKIPYRKRPGPVLIRKGAHGGELEANGFMSSNGYYSPSVSLNYGFCVSPKNMFWKHLLALSFSKEIGDSIPREDWFESVWEPWKEGDTNLEISVGYEHLIPYAGKV